MIGYCQRIYPIMPIQVVPLSDTKVRKATPQDKDYKLYDGHGLVVLVRPSGQKKLHFLRGRWWPMLRAKYQMPFIWQTKPVKVPREGVSFICIQSWKMHLKRGLLFIPTHSKKIGWFGRNEVKRQPHKSSWTSLNSFIRRRGWNRCLHTVEGALSSRMRPKNNFGWGKFAWCAIFGWP